MMNSDFHPAATSKSTGTTEGPNIAMPKSLKITLLTVSVIVTLALLAGGIGLRGVRAADADGKGAYSQIGVYSEVLRHIESDYVVDPQIPHVTDGALRGLLESLDSESSYMSPGEYTEYKADLAAGNAGVGLTVAKRYGYATIVSVQPQSPADKAGIYDGDIIVAMGAKSTHDLSLALIRAMLVGKPGSTVTISVVRPGTTKPNPITMTRAELTTSSVVDEKYDDGSVLYLKPGTLGHEQVSQIEQSLKAMPKGPARKILLDLRDVTDGDMHEAVRLANFFLDKGTIGSLEGQTVEHETYTADATKAINTTAPMVLLLNNGTAGPAELVADALMQNHRVDSVGERSFGEASELKLIELPDGGALLLAVGKYDSPAGKTIEDDPAVPDVVVASAGEADQSLDDEDEDLDDSAQPAPAPVVKPTVQTDDQLQKALDLLRDKKVGLAAPMQHPIASLHEAAIS
jgi:carboxyl-terminal processing protease